MMMFRMQVFNGRELVLDHAQPDFLKVLKFTLQALASLVNENVQDYRVTMADRTGTVFFYAVGPTTQTSDMAKVNMTVPTP